MSDVDEKKIKEFHTNNKNELVKPKKEDIEEFDELFGKKELSDESIHNDLDEEFGEKFQLDNKSREISLSAKSDHSNLESEEAESLSDSLKEIEMDSDQKKISDVHRISLASRNIEID